MGTQSLGPLGLFGQRKLRGDPQAGFSVVTEGTEPVLGGTLRRIRGSSHKLHHGKFQSGITKKLSSLGYSGTGGQDLVASPCALRKPGGHPALRQVLSVFLFAFRHSHRKQWLCNRETTSQWIYFLPLIEKENFCPMGNSGIFIFVFISNWNR